MAAQLRSPVWWVEPGKLGGMPLPFIDPKRRLDGGGPLEAYPDELPYLHRLGVRAFVCLLNTPGDGPVFERAGFVYRCLPMANGDPPTPAQCREFSEFVDRQFARARPVVVFCEAGLGRTGTMLAGYFIHRGVSATTAIARVRGIEPAAIETRRQIEFLYSLERLPRLPAGATAPQAEKFCPPSDTMPPAAPSAEDAP